MPEDILPKLDKFLREAERVLTRSAASSFSKNSWSCISPSSPLLALPNYTTRTIPPTPKSSKKKYPRLYNVDPSKNIRDALRRGTSAVFFSATLTPLDYFRQMLGGDEDDPMLSLDSPFPRENLRLLLADQIDTTYKKREESYGEVADSIAANVRQRRGNYLAFFPSYRYMQEVSERFAESHPDIDVLVQETGMSERGREAFLAVFAEDNARPTVGFAVMGGIFGEGIDLVGDRLVGAAIVGVGLPQICLERDLIRHYFDEADLPGFDYAYTFPGMNRSTGGRARYSHRRRPRHRAPIRPPL